MPRPDPALADKHERSTSPARGGALLAAALASALALVTATLTLVRGDGAGPAMLALLATGTACTAVAVGWALWRQRELVDALRNARAEAVGMRDLVDGAYWRSDAAHRLTVLRLPAAAGDGGWPAGRASGQLVWAYFGLDTAAAATLREHLDSGARLEGVPIWHVDGTGQRQAFELRASVLGDAQGRFAGYQGSARPLADDGDPRLLQALLKALPVPVFELAGADGAPARVQRGNAAAAQWLGIDPARLAGLGFADLQARLPPALRAPVVQALSGGGSEQPACPGWDVRVRRIETEAHPSGADGASRHWVLTLLPTVQDDAAAAPGEHESFSYTVSHDLRAPIRVVEGFTKILKEDYGRQLDRIGNDHLDRVLGAAARMNSMIDALLALSQLSTRPLSRQQVNLSQLAGFVVEDLRRQSPERSVAVHLEAGLQAQGDPTLLRVVLENLLGNAWKYSARKADAQVWFERGVADGQTVFTVRDNGAGFDMRFADRLFGVFQRLHSANDFPGTGIGLASVRRIVQRHGGEIWAESVVDRGSSFHFTLPANRAAG